MDVRDSNRKGLGEVHQFISDSPLVKSIRDTVFQGAAKYAELQGLSPEGSLKGESEGSYFTGVIKDSDVYVMQEMLKNGMTGSFTSDTVSEGVVKTNRDAEVLGKFLFKMKEDKQLQFLHKQGRCTEYTNSKEYKNSPEYASMHRALVNYQAKELKRTASDFIDNASFKNLKETAKALGNFGANALLVGTSIGIIKGSQKSKETVDDVIYYARTAVGSLEEKLEGSHTRVLSSSMEEADEGGSIREVSMTSSLEESNEGTLERFSSMRFSEQREVINNTLKDKEKPQKLLDGFKNSIVAKYEKASPKEQASIREELDTQLEESKAAGDKETRLWYLMLGLDLKQISATQAKNLPVGPSIEEIDEKAVKKAVLEQFPTMNFDKQRSFINETIKEISKEQRGDKEAFREILDSFRDTIVKKYEKASSDERASIMNEINAQIETSKKEISIQTEAFQLVGNQKILSWYFELQTDLMGIRLNQIKE